MTDLSALSADQLAEKVRGLRNLREGYSLAYAVDYFAREKGFDLVEEYAELVRRLKTAEDALERWRNGELDGEAAMVAIRYALQPKPSDELSPTSEEKP